MSLITNRDTTNHTYNIVSDNLSENSSYAIVEQVGTDDKTADEEIGTISTLLNTIQIVDKNTSLNNITLNTITNEKKNSPLEILQQEGIDDSLDTIEERSLHNTIEKKSTKQFNQIGRVTNLRNMKLLDLTAIVKDKESNNNSDSNRSHSSRGNSTLKRGDEDFICCITKMSDVVQFGQDVEFPQDLTYIKIQKGSGAEVLDCLLRKYFSLKNIGITNLDQLEERLKTEKGLTKICERFDRQILVRLFFVIERALCIGLKGDMLEAVRLFWKVTKQEIVQGLLQDKGNNTIELDESEEELQFLQKLALSHDINEESTLWNKKSALKATLIGCGDSSLALQDREIVKAIVEYLSTWRRAEDDGKLIKAIKDFQSQIIEREALLNEIAITNLSVQKEVLSLETYLVTLELKLKNLEQNIEITLKTISDLIPKVNIESEIRKDAENVIKDLLGEGESKIVESNIRHEQTRIIDESSTENETIKGLKGKNYEETFRKLLTELLKDAKGNFMGPRKFEKMIYQFPWGMSLQFYQTLERKGLLLSYLATLSFDSIPRN